MKKQKSYKRFLVKKEFHLFGYCIRITRDRPDWKNKKDRKGVELLSKQQLTTTFA